MKYTTNSIQLNDTLYFLLRYLSVTVITYNQAEKTKLRDDIEAYLRKNYKVEEE